jgi:hypothetical protein
VKDTRDKWKIPEGRTRSGGTDSLVNTFINGIEFAIGMVAGLVLLFYVARWVRLCYYRASKRTGDALPPDIRVRLIRDAIKGFARMRRSNPTEEQAREATAIMMATADDDSLPLDAKTLAALKQETVEMLKLAVRKYQDNSGPKPTP